MAQTCVDMKDQDRINTNGSFWYRCKRVSFEGDTATWELNPTGRYDFFESYQKRPHLQLIKANDDDALRVFVKAWGPLRLRLDSWNGCDPIEAYRRTRDVLTASVRLIASIQQPEMRRSALSDLVRLSKEEDEAFQTIPAMLRVKFAIPYDDLWGVDVNLQRWVEAATAKEIETACASLVSLMPLTDYSLKLRVDSSKKGSFVRASIGVTSLEDALHWMVWQDVFQKHRFQFCEECRKLFQPDWQHTKKYCTHECAHRKTSREWQLCKRKRERESNGTQKAR